MIEVERARALLDAGRPAEAAGVLTRLAAEEPHDPEVLGLLAQAHLEAGDAAAALTAGNRLLALRPDEEWGHRLCALALSRQRRFVEATRAANTAVSLAPLLWQTHVMYAQVAVDLPSARASARAAAHEAVRLAPDEPGTHFTVGVVAQAQGDKALARSAYERTLALDPEHANAVNNLTVLRKGRRLAPAARGYAAALRLDPQQETARRNIDVLTARLMVRLYYLGLVGFVVAVLVAGAQHDQDAVTAPKLLVAAGFAAALALYLTLVVRDVPPGVRSHALTTLRRPSLTTARGGMALVLMVLTFVALLVPGGVGATQLAWAPIGMLNVALVILGTWGRR